MVQVYHNNWSCCAIGILPRKSSTSGSVPDSTIQAIDRFFDLVDNGVEKLEYMLNRDKRIEEPTTKRPNRTPKQKVPKASTSTALARKSPFYIVEAISPTGTRFIVTDGGNARAECSTRELAEKLLNSLTP